MMEESNTSDSDDRDTKPPASATADTMIDEYDLRLDKEIQVVQTLRATMESLLQVLECARDDLVVVGDKMDKVRTASERCRKELMKRGGKQQQPQFKGKRKREDDQKGGV